MPAPSRRLIALRHPGCDKPPDCASRPFLSFTVCSIALSPIRFFIISKVDGGVIKFNAASPNHVIKFNAKQILALCLWDRVFWKTVQNVYVWRLDER